VRRPRSQTIVLLFVLPVQPPLQLTNVALVGRKSVICTPPAELLVLFVYVSV
jgi:hypothetical protein